LIKSDIKYSKNLPLYFLVAVFLCVSFLATAQKNEDLQNEMKPQKEVLFDRYLYKIGSSNYIGGYAHGSLNRFETEGISDGFNVTVPSIGAIVQSNIGQLLRFYAEGEYNSIDKKFQVNNLLIDFSNSPKFGIRIGYYNLPLGFYNQKSIKAHYNFLDDPLISTLVLPGPYSDAAFGIYGILGGEKSIVQLKYQFNVVEGLNEQILYTPSSNTEMQLGKNDDLFFDDNNNLPMYNGRIAFYQKDVFEIGASMLAGAYSNISSDSEPDTIRNLYSGVFDVQLYLGKLKIQSESALNIIHLPGSMDELYADKQYGTFVDLSYELFNLPHQYKRYLQHSLSIAARYDFVDLHVGYFDKTYEQISNEYYKASVGLVYRPREQSAVILNGNYQWFYDLLGNPAKKTMGIEFGFASYF